MSDFTHHSGLHSGTQTIDLEAVENQRVKGQKVNCLPLRNTIINKTIKYQKSVQKDREGENEAELLGPQNEAPWTSERGWIL